LLLRLPLLFLDKPQLVWGGLLLLSPLLLFAVFFRSAGERGAVVWSKNSISLKTRDIIMLKCGAGCAKRNGRLANGRSCAPKPGSGLDALAHPNCDFRTR